MDVYRGGSGAVERRRLGGPEYEPPAPAPATGPPLTTAIPASPAPPHGAAAPTPPARRWPCRALHGAGAGPA